MNSSSLEELCRLISRSTCQVFNFKPGTKEFPVPNGCALLFSFNGNFFAISNAHVLADKNHGTTFFLIGDGKTCNLGGHSFSTKLPLSGNRKDDTLDIAVVRLNAETVNALKTRGYNFLKLDNIKTGHQINENDKLLFVGYPASQTKIDVKNKKIISKPYFLRTTPVVKDYKNINFPKEFHVIAKYSRNKVLHPRFGTKIGAYPRGMSGSGIWLLRQNGNEFTAYLIGIFSEYLENRALLVGSKIDLYIDIIRQMIDSTIPNKGIQVKLLP